MQSDVHDQRAVPGNRRMRHGPGQTEGLRVCVLPRRRRAARAPSASRAAWAGPPAPACLARRRPASRAVSWSPTAPRPSTAAEGRTTRASVVPSRSSSSRFASPSRWHRRRGVRRCREAGQVFSRCCSRCDARGRDDPTSPACQTRVLEKIRAELSRLNDKSDEMNERLNETNERLDETNKRQTPRRCQCSHRVGPGWPAPRHARRLHPAPHRSRPASRRRRDGARVGERGDVRRVHRAAPAERSPLPRPGASLSAASPVEPDRRTRSLHSRASHLDTIDNPRVSALASKLL
jgi:hypothetical protein